MDPLIKFSYKINIANVSKKINITIYFKILTNCNLFTFLIHMSNFVLIRYYLLYNLYAYILCIILNYKNL